MDNKLDELKAKAQELLEVCNDETKKKETLDSLKNGMTAFLNDMKKLNKEDKVSLDSIADQVRNKIVTFMTADLNELQEDARNKIAASMDEKALQDTKVFFPRQKGKTYSHPQGYEGCIRRTAPGDRCPCQPGQRKCRSCYCRKDGRIESKETAAEN